MHCNLLTHQGTLHVQAASFLRDEETCATCTRAIADDVWRLYVCESRRAPMCGGLSASRCEQDPAIRVGPRFLLHACLQARHMLMTGQHSGTIVCKCLSMRQWLPLARDHVCQDCNGVPGVEQHHALQSEDQSMCTHSCQSVVSLANPLMCPAFKQRLLSTAG